MSEQDQRIAILEQRMDTVDNTMSRMWQELRRGREDHDRRLETMEAKDEERYKELMAAITSAKLTRAEWQGMGKAAAIAFSILFGVMTLGVAGANLVHKMFGGQ